MSSVNINIEPIIISYNSFRINSVSINLNQSAVIAISLYSDNTLVMFKNFVMSGDDYLSWGNDDNYLTNWVVQQLGATILPDTTIPDTTIPDTTIPDTTIPDTTIPDTTIPDTTIPN
jgi:hypothetical protein